MKRTIVILALLAPGVPALAQQDTDFTAAELVIGLWQRDSDTISSKFLEYRAIPQGVVAPEFRLHGQKGDYRYDLFGSDVTQTDQRYLGRFGTKSWELQAGYVGIPHNFGNAGRGILSPINELEDDWRLGNTLQQGFQSSVAALPAAARTYANLLAIVTPTLDAQPPNVDLKLVRDRTNLAFSLTPGDGSFKVGVTYLHERRSGSRSANGTAFGFNNVVETPEPVRYITQDFGVNASLEGGWGSAFFGFNFNDFSDKLDTFAWDNPFRAADATDGSAYLAPSSSSINGATFALMALPPSNEAWTVKGGTTLKLGSRTRLSADIQVGQWTQNEQRFIPWTTNTAVRTPSGALAITAPLPTASLDGKIDVLALNGFFTTRVADGLRLNARYRYYENENKTPRIRFEDGYVRYDAVWEDIPRITVPNGFDSGLFDVYATYDFGKVGIEAGWKYSRIARVFRETEHTSENTLRVAADLRFGDGVLLRGMYEFGQRDFEHYDAIEAEEHSFLEAGPPANQTVLRRYDQAKRDRNRFGGTLQFAPGSGKFTVAASYFWNQDKYDDSPVPCDGLSQLPASEVQYCPGGTSAPLGLQEAEYKTFSVDADVSPNDRVTFYGFYSREDIFDFQTGRQSGATITFNPAFGWSSTVDDKVDSVGAGARFALVRDKWFLDLFYRYQKVEGNNDFSAGASLNPAANPVQDILFYDDTRINFVSAQLRWAFAKAWAVGFGVFREDYDVVDSQDSVANYMPGSFFLNANNRDYEAWVGWINLSYRFN